MAEHLHTPKSFKELILKKIELNESLDFEERLLILGNIEWKREIYDTYFEKENFHKYAVDDFSNAFPDVQEKYFTPLTFAICFEQEYLYEQLKNKVDINFHTNNTLPPIFQAIINSHLYFNKVLKHPETDLNLKTQIKHLNNKTIANFIEYACFHYIENIYLSDKNRTSYFYVRQAPELYNIGVGLHFLRNKNIDFKKYLNPMRFQTLMECPGLHENFLKALPKKDFSYFFSFLERESNVNQVFFKNLIQEYDPNLFEKFIDSDCIRKVKPTNKDEVSLMLFILTKCMKKIGNVDKKMHAVEYMFKKNMHKINHDEEQIYQVLSTIFNQGVVDTFKIKNLKNSLTMELKEKNSLKKNKI